MSDAPVGALPVEPSTKDGKADPLALAASRREKRAFERIFKKYHQEIYRYCLSIVRRPEDAEDALQATMTAALRSLPGEKRDIALKPWLYRVAHNESISVLRQRRPTAELDETNDPIIESAHEEAASRARLRTLVTDLRTLPERQSSALVMRELNGLDYEEIGAALSCSGAAARQSVYEARTALRTLEEGREMECTDIRRAISDRDGRKLRGRKIKAHLAACDGCRGFAASIDQRKADLRALCPPLPAMAAAAMASGLIGGGSGAGGAAAGAAGAGSAGTTVGLGGLSGAGLAGSAAVKGASIFAGVVLAAGAADVSGVVDIPLPTGIGGGSSKSGDSAAPALDKDGGHGPAATGNSSAGSGRSEDAPGQTGSSPGQSEDAPGHGGNSPGQSENAPGHGGSSPGNSENAPGQTATSPGQSAEAPGQGGSSPGNSESAPGHGGSSPGNSGSAPGHSSTSPGNSSSAPGQTGSAGNSASAPGHSTTAPPGNSGSAPGHTGSTGSSVNVPSVSTPTLPGSSSSAPGQVGSAGNSATAPGHGK